MKKDNILFVYSDLGDGGIQKLISLLSKDLSKSYNLYLILFKNEILFDFKGEIICIDAPTTKNPFFLLKNHIRRIRLINKYRKKINSKCILTFSVISNMATVLSKIIYRFKTPVVISFHNDLDSKSKDMKFAGAISKFLNLYSIKYVDKVICVSKSMMENISSKVSKNYKNKFITIYNPVSFPEIRNLINEKIPDDHAGFFSNHNKVLITAGRLATQKNHIFLLEAFKEIKKNYHDVGLLILGEGPLRVELENYIYENNLLDNVLMPGWVKNPYKYIAKSDIFVLTSKWEGFPVALFEALACDTPVISSDCPTGPNEIVFDGINGYLYEMGNKTELISKISNILDGIGLDTKYNLKSYDVDVIANEYKKLIEEVVSDKDYK